MTEERQELPSYSALRGMLDELKGTLGNVKQAQNRLFEVRGIAFSDDRMIKATVGPRGQLIDLDLDPRIYRRPNSKALSLAIVATVKKAVEDATTKSQQIMEESVPTDMRAGRVGGMNLRKLAKTHDADLAAAREQEEEDDD